MTNKRISWSDAMDYALDHVTQMILTVIALVVGLSFASDGSPAGILCSFPFFALVVILIFQQSYKFLVDGVSNGISIYFDGLKLEKKSEKPQEGNGDSISGNQKQDNSTMQKKSGPTNIDQPDTGVKKKGPPTAESRENHELDSQQVLSGPTNIDQPDTGVKKKGPPPAESRENDELDSQQVLSGPEQDLTQVQKEINILTAMKNLARESNDEATFQQLTKDVDRLKKRRNKLRKLVGDD
ncbi:hypothetical protein OA172_00440 [Euryarchaeota archaeon]|nr:hypothetical protein [Euryarchaeota archaeon]